MINYILGSGIIVLMVYITIRLIRNRKNGGSCHGGCSSCEGCPYSGKH